MDSVGRALPFFILWPSIALFVLLIGAVIRRTPSTAARFVIFAVAFRFVLSALHEVTYKASPLGLSWNALASIAVFAFGMFMVRRRQAFDYALVPFYPLFAIMLASGLINGQVSDLATTFTKYAYLVVVILATVDALEDLGLEPLFRRLLWCFTFPVGLQAFSVLLGYAKPGEANGAASYIGGYYHEAGFSLVLASGLLVTCVLRDMKLRIQLPLILILLAGIVFANYRTAIVGVFPLVATVLLVSAPRRFLPRQRPLIVGAAVLMGMGVVAVGALSGGGDRFADLGVVYERGTDLIKPPGTFTVEERRLMSGRISIWSGYIYAWSDASPVRRLIGFGPETWGEVFELYAHNTLISALYEIGIFGVLAILFLWGWMLALASLARGSPRLILVGAHIGFFLLNMATMPMWMIEGMIFYGLLCGYTVYAFRHRTSQRPAPLPELQLEPQARLVTN